MEFMFVLFCLALLIVMIYLWYYIAKSFQEAAEDKGYFSKKYFHLTFWLPPIGMILVVALPDLNAQRYLKKMSDQASNAPTPASKQVNSAQTLHNDQLPNI